jgi:hypothetical protein
MIAPGHVASDSAFARTCGRCSMTQPFFTRCSTWQTVCSRSRLHSTQLAVRVGAVSKAFRSPDTPGFPLDQIQSRPGCLRQASERRLSLLRPNAVALLSRRSVLRANQSRPYQEARPLDATREGLDGGPPVTRPLSHDVDHRRPKAAINDALRFIRARRPPTATRVQTEGSSAH